MAGKSEFSGFKEMRTRAVGKAIGTVRAGAFRSPRKSPPLLSRKTRNALTFAPKARFIFRKDADLVQLRNPRSGKYVLIDRAEGSILSHKKSDGPYRFVPIAPGGG